MGGKPKLTLEYVKQQFANEGYCLNSKEYINNSTKLSVTCPIGHTYEVTYGNFQRGRRCPHCSGIAKHTYEFVKTYIESFNYKLLSDCYLGNHKHLEVECDKGHQYRVTFAHFQTGKRCPYCQGVAKYTIENIKAFCESIDYTYISGTLKDVNSKLIFSCDNDHIFKTSFRSLLVGHRCPVCNNSKGEKKIEFFLESRNIPFVYQHRFGDCRHKKSLPFDFYIPTLECCIEYDGIQHFKPIDYFGGIEEFENQKIKDEIKTLYCRDNNITLIRIPYFNFDNIPEILESKLKL